MWLVHTCDQPAYGVCSIEIYGIVLLSGEPYLAPELGVGGRNMKGMHLLNRLIGVFAVLAIVGSAIVVSKTPVRAVTLPTSTPGVVYSVGYDSLGNGTVAGTSSASWVQVCAPGQTSPCTGNFTNVTQLGNAGYDQETALTSSGNVYTWGYNYYGGLGTNDTNTSAFAASPVEVCAPGSTSYPCTSYLSNVTQITQAGDYGTSAALTSSGSVYTWGEGTHGDMGNGVASSSNYVPVQVCAVGQTAPCSAYLTGITELAAACDTFYGLTTSGTVVAWGDNASGELGNGTTGGQANIPVQVSIPAGVTITKIAASGSICSNFGAGYALSSTGNVYAWGDNSQGQLGNNSTANADIPVEVEGVGGSGFLSNVTDIAGGSFEGLAVVSGHVFTWGSMNNDGLSKDLTTSVLGNNAPLPGGGKYQPTPVEVCAPGQTAYPCTSFLSGIVSVAGDQYNENAYAIDGSGHVFAWGGDDKYGELGDGASGSGYAAGYAAVPLEMVDPSGTGYLHDVSGIGTGASILYVLVSQYTTTTSLTSSVSSPASTAGAITLTATVNGGSAPSGTVTFKEGSTALGTVTLGSSTTVTYTIPANTYTPGTYSFTASYNGDTANGASTSSALSLQLAYPISMSVSASPTSTTYGSSVTLTTTVSAQNSANGTPTGTVSLSDPGTPITGCQNLTLNASGVATCTTTALAVGAPTVVQASYSGSTTFLSGTSNANVTVGKGSVSIVVTSSPSSITFGQTATISATVTSTTAGTPSGTVSFSANGAAISGCQNLTLNASGVATCTTTALPQGTPVTLQASYSGDGNFASAVQGASITVNQAATTTAPAVSQPVPVPATGLHHSSLARGDVLPGMILAGLGLVALLATFGFRKRKGIQS